MAIFSQNPLFTFSSTLLTGASLGVVSFTGREALNRCYDFHLTLVSEDNKLALDELVSESAELSLHAESGRVRYRGVLVSMAATGTYEGYTFYRARLMPRLRWAAQGSQRRTFLDSASPDVMAAVLKEAGLSSRDMEFRLSASHEPFEFICQYGETHEDFFNRWVEREGLSYYFEQSATGEVLVITDSVQTCPSMTTSTLRFTPPSGLVEEGRSSQEMVRRFTGRAAFTARSVRVTDENYRTPSLDVSAEATVGDHGRGERSYRDLHARTQAEAQRLAEVRAEAQKSRAMRYLGESTVPGLRAGYRFTLEEHPRGDWNREYLVTAVSHTGRQTGALVSDILPALALEGGRGDGVVEYGNAFECVSADTPVRPERRARQPRLAGGVNATIDAGGSGEYAELDEEGRYTVRLPFDAAARVDGKGSHPVRLAQPYGGPDGGWHLPLTKGTEVVLQHLKGNPDRPYIAGALSNPETPSPVLAANQTQNVLLTHGDNTLTIQDQADQENMVFATPAKNTVLRLGMPGEPAGAWSAGEGSRAGYLSGTEGDLDLSVGGDAVVSVGDNKTETVHGASATFFVKGTESRTVEKQQTEEIQGARNSSVLSSQTEDFDETKEVTEGSSNTRLALKRQVNWKSKSDAIDQLVETLVSHELSSEEEAVSIATDVLVMLESEVAREEHNLEVDTHVLVALTAELTRSDLTQEIETAVRVCNERSDSIESQTREITTEVKVVKTMSHSGDSMSQDNGTCRIVLASTTSVTTDSADYS